MTSVFAHRGCTDGLVENTVAAFAEADRRGADGVELDVRRTADGALVVHHDATLADGRVICETALDLFPPYVPVLADALAACGGMTVNVEVKNSAGDPGYEPDQAIARDAARVVVDAGWARRVIVSSFERAALDALVAADAGLRLGWLLGVPVDPSGAVDEAAERGFQAIHPFVTWVDAPLVARAHDAGLAVNVWTVNCRHDLEAMVALGVDSVITDRLDDALLVARHTG
jgi:glycerophosphoryl diester phosphodiesterase